MLPVSYQLLLLCPIPSRLLFLLDCSSPSLHFLSPPISAPCGAGTSHSPCFPPSLFTSPYLTVFLLFLLSFSYLLYLFSYSVYPFLSTRMVPLHLQAADRRKRPNLGFSFFVLILCCLYFLVKDACFVLYLI